VTALLLAVFMQAPPRDSSIQDRIEAFLEGDAAAREDLLKWGRLSIPPLREARDKAPEKIDALVFELKRGLAYPKDSALPDLLEGKESSS
jgi:hypothetical protein